MAKALDYFNGIVELAKAGYKPNDVKDLLELLKTDPDIEAGSAGNLNTGKPSDSDKKTEAPKDVIDAIDAIIKREKGE